ncbi:GNAT family N-acetyltransferase [Shewanella sp.]|uniref:GNAT family N-acetyltransferase n=1 Tax=Shewanella sp. TaxID=50422 RepID=UPI00356AF688
MKFEVMHEEDTKVFNALVEGVRQHIHEQMGDEGPKPLTLVARDEDGSLLGGVSGRTIYRNFLIEVVWVTKHCRGTGLGRKLMEMAELEARKRGCLLAQLDTLSIQAPVFYQKLGFELAGVVPEFPGSPERYFLMKQYL